MKKPFFRTPEFAPFTDNYWRDWLCWFGGLSLLWAEMGYFYFPPCYTGVAGTLVTGIINWQIDKSK
jgi:hypothetical protein